MKVIATFVISYALQATLHWLDLTALRHLDWTGILVSAGPEVTWKLAGEPDRGWTLTPHLAGSRRKASRARFCSAHEPDIDIDRIITWYHAIPRHEEDKNLTSQSLMKAGKGHQPSVDVIRYTKPSVDVIRYTKNINSDVYLGRRCLPLTWQSLSAMSMNSLPP
jgi:hypothetical protein